MQKRGIFRASPRTWRATQGHVALARGRARVPAWHWGDVSFTYIFYYIGYSTYKHSIEEFMLTALILIHYIRAILRHFLRVGQLTFDFFDFKARGTMWSVGWNPRLTDCVDAMDTRFIRSRIAHVLQFFT